MLLATGCAVSGCDETGVPRFPTEVTAGLTDGDTPWPAAAPKGMRVVVGLLGEGAPDAPPWTRSVRVEP